MKTQSKEQAAEYESLKFFISHYNLQSKMLLILLLHVAKPLSPHSQIVTFSLLVLLMIVFVLLNITHPAVKYLTVLVTLVSQRREIGTSGV